MNQKPGSDEIEVTIVGPGYGESIALHLGNNQWYIIDSCLNPKTKKNAVIEYLEAIGVDVETAVKKVLITHYHDDHIAGLSELVQTCKSAKIFLSTAFSTKDFLKLIVKYKKDDTTRVSSGTKEIYETFRCLYDRKTDFNYVTENTYLYDVDYDNRIKALSPSGHSITLAINNVRELIDVKLNEPCDVLPQLKKNYASIVLFCKLKGTCILLGSDIEVGNLKHGWLKIVNDTDVCPREKSELYKVAHHGSKTGHLDKVWNDLLIDNPLSVLTPWHCADNSLPQKVDIERINNKTDHAYITATPKRYKKAKFSDSVVRKEIEKMVLDIKKLKLDFGIVQMRKHSLDSDWKIELHNDAIKLSDIK